MSFYTALLAAAENGPGNGGNGQGPGIDLPCLLVMVASFAVLYFFVIYPQRKKEKERQRKREEMLNALQRNDHVMTIGGIHGVVTSVAEDEVTIRVDEKSDVKVRVSRDAISKVVGDEEGEEEETTT